MSPLSCIVSVRTRYRRSVNLTVDSHDPETLNDFLVTPLVTYTLERLFEALENPRGGRSIMLYGPYGAGKSTFALFLNALFRQGAQKNSRAYALLCKEAELGQRFAALCCAPWLCVPVTARRHPSSQIVLEGLHDALDTLPDNEDCRALRLRIDEALNAGLRDSAIVLEFVESARLLAARLKLGGMLLVIDEAGKSLEYALQDREGGDVYLFQVLAEHAGRSRDVPFLFMTVQHQYFEGYAELSDNTLRHEWAKVQQRFETLRFDEQLSSGLNTLGQVLQYAQPLPDALLSAIDEAAHTVLRAGNLPPGMMEQDFLNICRRAWPLHPSVVLSLPLLFRRLAQNERSVFSYLSSQEPYGFQEHCRRDLNEDNGFVRLYDIADYLLSNMAVALTQRARILLEILGNDGDLSLLQQRILRVTGILNVLGIDAPFKATETALAAALPQDGELREALGNLRRCGRLTFRQADRSFRLWEGGSIDIEELLQKARTQVRCEGVAFLELVREHVSMRPLVARRHCLQSGAYRFFDVQYALSTEAVRPAEITSSRAGQVLVLLPMRDVGQTEDEARKATEKNNSLVIAVPQQVDMLRQPTVELACLREVQKRTPDLRGDKRALREFGLLLADCERRVRQNAALLLDPRPAPLGNNCRWFWRGKPQPVRRPVDVTRLLSDVCDALYPDAPFIRNELVARPQLSSAGTAARNILLKLMVESAHLENLGIEGFPPERSMYESVLRAPGLHVRDGNGWTLRPPTRESSLFAVWQEMTSVIYGAGGESVPLTRLFERLVSTPYGVPEGVLPILLLACYVCNSSEMFLYREQSFLTRLDGNSIELLQRRPDLFAISGVRLEGERRLLVQRYADGLHVEPTVPAVVSCLFAAIRQLPAMTLHSANLAPTRGKALRDCFRSARSPERLLFEDLPAAFGIPSLLSAPTEGAAEEFAAAMRESMSELLDYAPRARERCRDVFLHACGLPKGTAGWHTFVERAGFLAKRVRHGVIVPVLDRASLTEMDEDRRLEAVLGRICGRPFERWSDADVAAFADMAQGAGEQFRRAWEDYGSIFLDAEEQKAKERLENELNMQFSALRGKYSSRVLAEALRGMLRSLEEIGGEE